MTVLKISTMVNGMCQYSFFLSCGIVFYCVPVSSYAVHYFIVFDCTSDNLYCDVFVSVGFVVISLKNRSLVVDVALYVRYVVDLWAC